MSAILDWAIVLLAIGGALFWLVRRFRGARAGACSSGCGKCEEARGNAGRRPAPGPTVLPLPRSGVGPREAPGSSAGRRGGRPRER